MAVQYVPVDRAGFGVMPTSALRRLCRPADYADVVARIPCGHGFRTGEVARDIAASGVEHERRVRRMHCSCRVLP
jgi:hypothetical protein